MEQPGLSTKLRQQLSFREEGAAGGQASRSVEWKGLREGLGEDQLGEQDSCEVKMRFEDREARGDRRILRLDGRELFRPSPSQHLGILTRVLVLPLP